MRTQDIEVLIFYVKMKDSFALLNQLSCRVEPLRHEKDETLCLSG